jgi:hypothetical protein
MGLEIASTNLYATLRNLTAVNAAVRKLYVK